MRYGPFQGFVSSGRSWNWIVFLLRFRDCQGHNEDDGINDFLLSSRWYTWFCHRILWLVTTRNTKKLIS